MPELNHSVNVVCEACVIASAPTAAPPIQNVSFFFSNLLNTEGFPPRWNCGTGWTTGHGWLHIISDFAIFGAYFAIPMVLAYFILARKDIPFPPILWLFVAFIAMCGVGHLVEGTIFWTPWYRLSGLLKALTAIVSWITVVALIRIVPTALNLPGLAVVNAELEREVLERKTAEEKLQRSYDELQEFTSNVLGREERVLELKKEVNRLLDELGREPAYLADVPD